MSVSRQTDIYTKTETRRPDATVIEGLGLQWLAQAQDEGGAHVVPVVRQPQPGQLRTRAIASGRCSAAAAHRFGAALALTHAAGADHFGQAPAGWDGDGWMGLAPLTYVGAADPGRGRAWGEFYAEERLLPHLAAATSSGSIDTAGARLIESLCERLRDGDFDSPQPQLVRSPAARIHGDLWSGNVLWAPRASVDWAPERAGTGGLNTPLPEDVGVLIDPAAQGGHAETDLATLGVFGQSHLEQIYAGYNSVSPLAQGWRERVGLHQLHILIIHAQLFGAGYGYETVAMARRYAN